MSPMETLEQSESWTCTEMGLKCSLKLSMSLLLFYSLPLRILSYLSENPQNFTLNTSPFSSATTLTLYHALSTSALYSISASSSHDDMSFFDSFLSFFFFFAFLSNIYASSFFFFFLLLFFFSFLEVASSSFSFLYFFFNYFDFLIGGRDIFFFN